MRRPPFRERSAAQLIPLVGPRQSKDAPYQPAPYQPAPYQPAPYQPAPYQPAPYQPARRQSASVAATVARRFDISEPIAVVLTGGRAVRCVRLSAHSGRRRKFVGVTGCRPEVRRGPFVAGPSSRALRRGPVRRGPVRRGPFVAGLPSRLRCRDRGALSAPSYGVSRTYEDRWKPRGYWLLATTACVLVDAAAGFESSPATETAGASAQIAGVASLDAASAGGDHVRRADVVVRDRPQLQQRLQGRRLSPGVSGVPPGDHGT